MDGGIDINYGCKDFILLLGWMDVGMGNSCWLHPIQAWKPPQIILLCRIDTTPTWELISDINVGAKRQQAYYKGYCAST
jgi:hypothetical protein